MFARGATLALALLLAACGGRDARAPFTDSRIPPSLAPADWPPDGWTWGLIGQGRAPSQRYGMAGPDVVPQGQVLILPGYGEAAEDYYRTARALTALGYVVWILDGAGQGGSGRLTGARDLGHVDDFGGDVAAAGAMIDTVMPSDFQGPVILVASSTAADIALRRLQLGAPVTGLVLLAPTRRAPATGAALPDHANLAWAQRLHLGRSRARGQAAWSSGGPVFGAGLSAQTYRAWRAANPDLRMGGPTYGWLSAFEALQAQVDATGLTGVRAPVLILGPTTGAAVDAALRQRLCRALPRCIQEGFADAAGADRQVTEFIETLRVQAAPSPPGPALSKPAADR